MKMAESVAGDAVDGVGTGGFATKLQATRIAWEHGINVVIANGRTRNIIPRVMEGEELGTLFEAPASRRPNEWLERKWPISGHVVVTEAAAEKMMKMSDVWMSDVVEGLVDFTRGSIVTIRTKDKIIGRGIAGYGAVDVDKLKGQDKEKQLKTMGPKMFDGPLFHPEDYVSYTINP